VTSIFFPVTIIKPYPSILSKFGVMHSLTRKIIFCSLLFTCFSRLNSSAQTIPDTTRNIIQFSGLVVDRDSLNPLPFVAVVVRGTQRGVFGNATGYYSIAVQEKDTLDFYALGYHPAAFVVPDTFALSNSYNHVQSLALDTILLREAVVYPWPSKERFKSAFLALDVPTDDLDRARKNLAQADIVQQAQDIAMDAGMIAEAANQQQVARNYYAGGTRPNNLLNPIAWSRFIQAMNRGDFKRQ
jgi:hypothetical protein